MEGLNQHHHLRMNGIENIQHKDSHHLGKIRHEKNEDDGLEGISKIVFSRGQRLWIMEEMHENEHICILEEMKEVDPMEQT